MYKGDFILKYINNFNQVVRSLKNIYAIINDEDYVFLLSSLQDLMKIKKM